MFFLVSLMRLTVGVVLIFYVAWLGILLVFFGFLLGFLGDFFENLQRYLCVLFDLDFCWCFLGFYQF